jgi:cation diffusion facilitator family transporter
MAVEHGSHSQWVHSISSVSEGPPSIQVIAPSTVQTNNEESEWITSSPQALALRTQDDGNNASSTTDTQMTNKIRFSLTELQLDKDQVAPSSTLSTSRFRFSWPFSTQRKLQKYYQEVKEDEAALKEAESTLQEDEENEVAPKKRCARIQLKVSTAARLTLSVNFLLLFMKLAASIQSGSLAVISSLLDSVLDLFSGVVISVTNYLIRHYNPFRYPIGRNRLLPVAIIITAAVMGTASLQIVTTAIEDIANGSVDPHINEFSGAIIAVTIILKGVLFLLCFRVDSAAVRALAVDHRNDVASNLAALVFGLLGTYVWKYLDPIGAILLSFYIIVNWILVGREQIRNLVGHRADRRFISKLIYLSKEHSDEIVNVDTVRAYTFGINYLVEVHIVLKPDTLLSAAHDIGESLQLKIEGLKEVERAFVHLDFETLHSPSTEHIQPEPAD